MAIAATVAVDLIARTDQFAAAMKETTQKAREVGETLKDIGKNMSMFVTAPIVGGFALATMAADKQAEAEAKLAAVIKATGGAAGITAEEIKTLAQQLQRTTTFGDETTIAGAAVLLTFKSIRNELGEGNQVFNRAVAVGQDLAALMGGDLQGSMVMLGKALEDPIQGVSALRRVGVGLSEQQTDLIKTMMDANDVVGAQKIVLEALESQVGGTAAEMAQTVGGQMRKAFNDLGDAMERIGQVFDPVRARLASGLSDLAMRFQALPDSVIVVGVVVASLAAAIGPLIFVVGQLFTSYAAIITQAPKVAQALGTIGQVISTNVIPAVTKLYALIVANPVGVLVVALAALAAGFVYVYQRSETFREVTAGIVEPVLNLARAIREGLGATLIWLGDAFTAVFGKIIETTSGFVGGVLRFIGGVLPDGVRESMERFAENMTTRVRSAVDTTKQIISELRAPSLDLGVTGSNSAAQSALYGPIIEASNNAGEILTTSATAVESATSAQVAQQIELAAVTAPVLQNMEFLTTRIQSATQAQGVSMDALLQGARLQTLNSSELARLTQHQAMLREELATGTLTLARRNELTEELNKTTQALNASQIQTTSAMGQLKNQGMTQITGLLNQFSPMGIAMELLGDVFKALQPIIDKLKEPIKLVAVALGNALLPVLKALWPIFRMMAIAGTYFAQIIFSVVGGIQQVVGGVIRAIGNVIAKIPLLGGVGRGIAGAGESIQNVGKGFSEAAKSMADAREELRNLNFDGDSEDKTAALLTDSNKQQETIAGNTARMADALEDLERPNVSVTVQVMGGGDASFLDGERIANVVVRKIDEALGETTLRDARLEGVMAL
jgi:phage-related protein